MPEQQKPDLSKVEPIGTWSRPEEPRGGSGSDDAGTATDPIPGTPPAVPLVGEATEQEPWTSPETEHELDRLRRG